jgi:hypothetical protein
MKNSAVVDVSPPIDTVVSQVRELILKYHQSKGVIPGQTND